MKIEKKKSTFTSSLLLLGLCLWLNFWNFVLKLWDPLDFLGLEFFLSGWISSVTMAASGPPWWTISTSSRSVHSIAESFCSTPDCHDMGKNLRIISGKYFTNELTQLITQEWWPSYSSTVISNYRGQIVAIMCLLKWHLFEKCCKRNASVCLKEDDWCLMKI